MIAHQAIDGAQGVHAAVRIDHGRQHEAVAVARRRLGHRRRVGGVDREQRVADALLLHHRHHLVERRAAEHLVGAVEVVGRDPHQKLRPLRLGDLGREGIHPAVDDVTHGSPMCTDGRR